MIGLRRVSGRYGIRYRVKGDARGHLRIIFHRDTQEQRIIDHEHIVRDVDERYVKRAVLYGNRLVFLPERKSAGQCCVEAYGYLNGVLVEQGICCGRYIAVRGGACQRAADRYFRVGRGKARAGRKQYDDGADCFE
jgi:hypothetical protein